MPHYWLQISSKYLPNFPRIIRFSILVSRNRHNSQFCMNAWNFHISSFSLDLVLTSSVLCPANSSFFNQPKSSVHLLNSGHLLGFLDSPSLGCSLESLLRQYSGAVTGLKPLASHHSGTFTFITWCIVSWQFFHVFYLVFCFFNVGW